MRNSASNGAHFADLSKSDEALLCLLQGYVPRDEARRFCNILQLYLNRSAEGLRAHHRTEC